MQFSHDKIWGIFSSDRYVRLAEGRQKSISLEAPQTNSFPIREDLEEIPIETIITFEDL